MSQLPLHLYLTKYFWKKWYKRKKKAWQVFVFETKKKYRRKRTYKYVFWKITKTEKRKNKLSLQIPPLISKRKFSFLLKTNYKPWWWRTMITTTLLVLLGIPTAYFGYPKLKEYKFYKFKKTAAAALQSNDLQTALLTSQAAHLLNRMDFTNLKTLVKAAEKLKHPRHLEWLKILANHPEAGTEDHANYLSALLQNKWLNDADAWLAKHASSFPEKDRIYYQCLILSKQGEESKYQAIEMGLRYIMQNPDISPLSEFIWDLSLQSQQIYFYEEAIKQMTDRVNINSSLSAPALRRLLKTQTGLFDQRKDWAKKLWSIDDLSLLDAILCLNASFGEKVINGNSILHFLQKDFPELSSPEARDKLITLLNQVGRPETAKQILENAEANTTSTKKIFIDTIHSALQYQDTNLAQDLIDQAIPELSPTEKIFFDHLLKEVLSPKGLSSKHLAKLFVESNEQELETIRLFLRFFQKPEFLVSLIEQMEIMKPDQIGLKYLLATSYHRTGDFSKLKEIISRTPLPETVRDITGERQTCIQKALYGIDLKACTKWAESAFSKNPNSLANRFTLALCYLQKNNPQSARSLLAPLLQRSPPLCPTQRIIGALTLHRNQASEQAKQWAPIKHISLLTDAEKKFLGEIMHSRK
jgi:hypothetical protein